MAASEWLLKAIEVAFGNGIPKTGPSVTPVTPRCNPSVTGKLLKSLPVTPVTPVTPENNNVCTKAAEHIGHAAEQTEVCQALRRALAREIWAADGERVFVIDTSVRAIQPLLDQVPMGIDPEDWRRAVEVLNTGWADQVVSRDYDQQPVLTIPAKRLDLGGKATGDGSRQRRAMR